MAKQRKTSLLAGRKGPDPSRGPYKMRTDAYEISLIRLYQEGFKADPRSDLGRQGRSAADLLVKRYDAMIRAFVAPHAHRTGIPFEDLWQEGAVGFLRGVRDFKPELGYQLSTYSVYWVWHGIRDIMVDDPMIRLPHHMRETLGKAAARGVDTSNMESLAAAGVFNEDQQRRLHGAALFVGKPLSLDVPRSSHLDGNVPWVEDMANDLPEVDDEVTDLRAERHAKAEVAAALAQLTPKQQAIIKARYLRPRGEPMTLDTIGRCYKVSKEAIRQAEAKALAKLAQILKARRMLAEQEQRDRRAAA